MFEFHIPTLPYFFSEFLQEKKPEKVAIEPRRPAITVNNVLNMSEGQISSLFQSNSDSSKSSRKKKASEPVRQAKKPYHMPILVDLEPNDSGIGKLSYSQVYPLDLRCHSLKSAHIPCGTYVNPHISSS